MNAIPPPPPPPPASVMGFGVVVDGKVEQQIRHRLSLGIVLAVVGVIAAVVIPGYHYAEMGHAVAAFQRASAEKSAVIDVDEPVEYRVYVEPDDAPLRDVRWSIVELETGQLARVGEQQFDFRYSVPDFSGRSLTSVELDPGQYLFEVEGPQTVAIGPSQLGRLVWMWGGGLVFGGVPIVIGLGLMASASMRRARLRRWGPEQGQAGASYG